MFCRVKLTMTSKIVTWIHANIRLQEIRHACSCFYNRYAIAIKPFIDAYRTLENLCWVYALYPRNGYPSSLHYEHELGHSGCLIPNGFGWEAGHFGPTTEPDFRSAVSSPFPAPQDADSKHSTQLHHGHFREGIWRDESTPATVVVRKRHYRDSSKRLWRCREVSEDSMVSLLCSLWEKVIWSEMKLINFLTPFLTPITMTTEESSSFWIWEETDSHRFRHRQFPNYRT